MNRNQNSHFSKNPQVDIQRSRFDRSSSIKFSGNVGDIIPFYVDEVLPGDTFDIELSKLVRLQTLITPVMDNLYLDTYWFYVPYRLVWEHWKEFMGENTKAPWFSDVEYSVPQVSVPSVNTSVPPNSAGEDYRGWLPGTIADYMGIPHVWSSSDINATVSALPFRAYALIYNEWFRDENLQTPQTVSTGDALIAGASFPVDTNFSPLSQAERGGFPLKAGKFRDYFTSCLPSPQKGPDVLLPLGSKAPVYAFEERINHDLMPKLSSSGNFVPSNWIGSEGGSLTNNRSYNAIMYGNPDGSGTIRRGSEVSDAGAMESVVPDNLWADLNNATAATVNQLRLAFAIQRIYEKDARGGSRYIEILSNHFGDTSPDSRLQRPEYLGGNRMLINVNQVVQNSESATTPQGTTTAYSLTVDTHKDFTQSFVEHGILMGLCVARYEHTYQQGLERFWSRKNRFDFYWPSLANIGEQPVYNKEIYFQGNSVDDEVFGYQEAFADYRYKPNRVAGEMRSGIDKTLDSWHLADDYSSQPFLSADWIQEDKTNVDRCLAVTSTVANQFFADFYVKNLCTRPMPVFSIPGLIDHH